MGYYVLYSPGSVVSGTEFGVDVWPVVTSSVVVGSGGTGVVVVIVVVIVVVEGALH